MRSLCNGRISVAAAAFAVVWLGTAPPAAALVPDCGLRPGGSGRVAGVIDGDTVVLEDGSEVRLVGTQAPKLPLGRRGFPTWPLAPEARAALESLTLGKRVELRYGGERIDRHGRKLAHLFVESDGPLWVQGEMVRRGLARTYSFADNRSCVRELQSREATARTGRRGIWTNGYYRLRDAAEPAALLRLVDTYQLVEGRVLAAADVRGRIFLNFGPNYRDDFTAVVAPGDARRFRGGPIDLLALEGRRVRVRGWLENHNGPSIDVTHPEQIEIIE
jgi:endonuclease YncB( thermonuclease family)